MFRFLVTLGGAALAGSFLLPFLAGPFGQTAIPYDMFRLAWDNLGTDLPVEAWVVLSTFAGGALIAVLALFGAAPRLLAFLAGVWPLAVIGYGVTYARGEMAAAGLPVPEGADLRAIWEQLSPVVGNGLWIYLGASVVIILGSLMSRR